MKQMQEGRPNHLLKRARHKLGWTQQELGDLLGVSPRTIGAWERGTRSPYPAARRQLCELFDMSPEELGLSPSFEDNGLLIQEYQERELQLQQPPPNRSDKNRMIDRVRARVVSLLESSLQFTIQLQLRSCPNAVGRRWQPTYAIEERGILLDRSILDIYEESGGELLILGEAGAGKTTILLLLARELLNRASENDQLPIPVVFNLASWAEKRPPLSVWLVDELVEGYYVPRRLAQAWIDQEIVLPMLDGLDEVGDNLTDCIEAINQYHKTHGLLPMVVCCRGSSYFAQEQRLFLNRAVTIEPLSWQQIDNLLLQLDKPALRLAMDDIELRNALSSPLMLLALLATEEDISSSSSPRKPLIEKYAQVLLRRMKQRSKKTNYWLHKMAQQHQTEFYVERMQPDQWLSQDMQPWYQNLVIWCVYAPLCFILAAILALLRGGKENGQFGVGAGLLGWLGGGPANQVLGWMAPGIGSGLAGGGTVCFIFVICVLLIMLLADISARKETIQFSWSQTWIGMRYGGATFLVVGIPAGGVISVSRGWTQGLTHALGFGFFCGMLVGFISFLMAGRSPILAQRQMKMRIVDGVIIGICGGLGFGLVEYMLVGFSEAWVYGVVVGAAFAAMFAVGRGAMMFQSLMGPIRPVEVATWSWRCVYQNLSGDFRYACIVCGCITLYVSILFATVSSLSHLEYEDGLVYGLVYGPIVGLIAGVACLLSRMLNSGWSSSMLEDRMLQRPNEGIRRSIRHAGFVACLFGLVGGIASGLVSGLAFVIARLPGWLVLGSGFGIVLGVAFALIFGIVHGGIACAQHYLLRIMLWRMGCMPLNYIRFLDDAAHSGILRKIGGGYIFSHRLLQDYFALDQTEKSKDDNCSGDG